MKRLTIVSLAAVALVLSGCAKLTIAPQTPPTPPGPPKIIWSGRSAGYIIRWTASDIAAMPVAKPSGTTLSELGLTIYDFHQISRQQTADCDFVRVAQVQSVVGPIVSILDNDSMRCSNGTTSIDRKTVAIDLRHPTTQALLTDYFPARELSSLLLRVARSCSTKPENLLNGFSFDELHGNAVLLAVTLPTSCSSSSINMALNVPAKLARALMLAASRRQGFLLRDQGAVSGEQTTTINYHYRTTSS
jgi:hypothetical protein